MVNLSHYSGFNYTKSAFILNKSRLEHGLVHYYYGQGRGKTCTSIGTIIRALGHGLRPILIQFLKLHDELAQHSGFFIGEINFLKKLIPIKQFGSYEFIYPNKEIPEEHFSKADQGLEYAERAIHSGTYDLVVLDEIAVAISLKLINLDDVLKIIQDKPKRVEIIMTGASYINELEKIADYCTEFTCVNHPYYQGYDARPGIEF
ncbi:MAG: cob(I)yrinic acid a,c-diamide adenosyltransferase [Promethearchaeota archaeon]|nr:MAG: cob(I)yrinic acid a,c-diamide adenosyltransferase [Candidatus Lokiarchaeota archaeon]